MLVRILVAMALTLGVGVVLGFLTADLHRPAEAALMGGDSSPWTLGCGGTAAACYAVHTNGDAYLLFGKKAPIYLGRLTVRH